LKGRYAAYLVFCLWAVLLPLAPGTASAQGLSAAAGLDKPLGRREPELEPLLRLSGSRGETLNFLMKAGLPGCHAVSYAPFASPAAQLDLPIRFYHMPTVRTRRPSFSGAYVGEHYDPLLPNGDGVICSEQGKAVWQAGEIAIPNDAAPGEYEGAIVLGGERLPIRLRIWKMTIPETPALPAYSELTTWFNLLGHYGAWVDQEPELAALYVREMNAHRLYPVKSGIDMPALQDQGGRLLLDIWNSPDARQAFYPVTLAERPPWAYYDFPTLYPSDVGGSFMRRYFTAVENTIPDINRPGKAFVYLWDEPPPDQYRLLRRFARGVKRLAPSLKVMVTTPYSRYLEKSVDIFVPLMNDFEKPGLARPAAYRALQARGKEVWWYVSCVSHGCGNSADPGTPDFVIDRPPSYIRSVAWLSARYHIDAFLYYSVNNGYQFYPRRDPWRSLWDFSGNGDGTLFYPGRPGQHGLTAHTAVPSLRLKVWRESSYDAEYIRWMNDLDAAPDWWRQELAALVSSTTRWNRSYSAFRSLRNRAGEYLDGIR